MNKKIIAISLLVIVAAISVSGCLGPNEDEVYNEKMTEIYNDMDALNETLKETNNAETVANTADSNYIKEMISTCDNVTIIIDNDTQKLKELNETISNTTRKDYLGICADELTKLNEMINVTKELFTLINDYNNKKVTINEVQSKYNKIDSKVQKISKKMEELDEKRLDYEKKYPFVLINGTISTFGNETLELGE